MGPSHGNILKLLSQTVATASMAALFAWPAAAAPPQAAAVDAGLPAALALVLGLAAALALWASLGAGRPGPAEFPRPEGLVKSRDKLKAVFDAVEDPIISLTADLSVESINLSAASWAGRHPRELVGAPGEQVLTAMGLIPRVRSEVLDTVALALEQGQVERRLLHWPQDGGSSLFKLSVGPALDEAGRPALVIVHLRDLTEDKSGLMREAQRLAETVEDLKRLDQAKRDQANMVVHDLKGPLTEIMGNLELIGMEPVSPTQREYLDLASSGAEHLMQMILNMLNVARLMEGRLKVRQQEVDFAGLAGRVRDRFKTLAALKGIVVEVEDQAGGPVWADPEILERVVQNLFINSLNHTPEGGSIGLAARPGEKGGFELCVSDTGKGIPPAQLKRIFERYEQAEGPPASPGGTGLGLTFCKLAVAAHGGELRVESQVGQGTRVFVRLPGAQA